MASAADTASDETLRQCALTRVRRDVGALIRFVLDPQDRVVPDLRCRLPGRGVWLTGRRDVVDEAVRRHVFSRAFRKAVEVDAGLAETVDGLLVRASLADLGFANKAGQLVHGFAKIEVRGGKGDIVALIHARDAAPGGGEKLSRACARGADGEHRALPVITTFKNDELSLALGQPNVVHAALTGGGASRKFLISAARLEGYRAQAAVTAVSEDRDLGEA